MGKYAIVATFEVELDKMNDFLPLLKAHSKRCIENEPGTLQFDVLKPNEKDNEVRVYEVYKDKAAFEEHWNSPFLKRITEETKGMVKNLSGIRCTVIE